MSGISLKNKNFIDGMRLFEEDRKVDPDFIIETLKEAHRCAGSYGQSHHRKK